MGEVIEARRPAGWEESGSTHLGNVSDTGQRPPVRVATGGQFAS